jgi:hypothetical protein
MPRRQPLAALMAASICQLPPALSAERLAEGGLRLPSALVGQDLHAVLGQGLHRQLRDVLGPDLRRVDPRGEIGVHEARMYADDEGALVARCPVTFFTSPLPGGEPGHPARHDSSPLS